MYTVEKSMAEHWDEILTAVEGMLADARGAGQPLADVRCINRGDRALLNEIEPPTLWIFPGADTIEPSGGQASIHTFEIIIVGVVGGLEPREGFAAASNLTARAYDVLLTDRSWRGSVNEARPVRFDPASERFRSKQLYAATAVFAGKVRRRE
jgi:hypothetical protein